MSPTLGTSFIYFACLGDVCFYPINVKTAEPIGPKIFDKTPMTLGKIRGIAEFQKFVFKQI